MNVNAFPMSHSLLRRKSDRKVSRVAEGEIEINALRTFHETTDVWRSSSNWIRLTSVNLTSSNITHCVCTAFIFGATSSHHLPASQKSRSRCLSGRKLTIWWVEQQTMSFRTKQELTDATRARSFVSFSLEKRKSFGVDRWYRVNTRRQETNRKLHKMNPKHTHRRRNTIESE